MLEGFSYHSVYCRGDQRAKVHWLEGLEGPIRPVGHLLRTPAIAQNSIANHAQCNSSYKLVLN